MINLDKKSIIFDPPHLDYHHKHNWMLQFWCSYSSGNYEYKDEMIKVEAVSINVYDRGVDGYFAMVTFVHIWIIDKTEFHLDGNVWVTIYSIKKRGSVTK